MAYEDRLIRDIADYNEATLESGAGLINGQIGVANDTKRVVAKDEDGDFFKCATLEEDAEFLDVTGDDFYVDDSVLHYGDDDTGIVFSTDRIDLQSGGITLLSLIEDTQDVVNINQGQLDADTIINALGINAVVVEGETGFVGIGDFADDAANIEVALHIHFGEPGSGADPYVDTKLLIEHSDDLYAECLLPDNKAFRILFGNETDSGYSEFKYDNATHSFKFACFDSGSGVETLFSFYDWSGITNGKFGVRIVSIPDERVYFKNDATNAYAVLGLEQLDDDEPFIHFKGKSISEDITRSLVAAGDATFSNLAFVKAELTDLNDAIADQDCYLVVGTLS